MQGQFLSLHIFKGVLHFATRPFCVRILYGFLTLRLFMWKRRCIHAILSVKTGTEAGRFMKKIRMLSAAILAVVVLFCSCGNVLSAERTMEKTELFRKAEIRSAMRVAETHFFANFDGCELLEIRYDEEGTLREQARREERGEKGEVIVLASSFYVEKSDGSLTPGMTYNGWSWELERTIFGTWKIVNAGYA